MKTQIRWVVACACLGVAAGAFAQASYTDTSSSPTTQTTGTRITGKSRQFCHSKELVGASVKDSQGEKLGDIYDVIFSPQNGEAFAAISMGHSTYALVPVQALNITPGTRLLSRKADVTLNATKETLENGPTVQNEEWEKLDAPSFSQSIYSHYQLQAPSMGGVGTGAFSGSSRGEGTNSTVQPTPEPPQ